jgi:FkbM family methyltransferase
MLGSLLRKTIEFLQLWQYYGLAQAITITVGLRLKRTVRVTTFDGYRFAVNPEEMAAAHLIQSVAKIQKLAASVPRENCRCILDIGANCGLFGLFAKKRFPGAAIYSLEPSENLQAVLKENLSFGDSHIFPYAVGDKDGYTNLYINTESEQTNSLIRSVVETTSRGHRIITGRVKSVRLDTFVMEQGIEHIDILKVDIQGAEHMIFTDGINALSKTDYLLLEVTFFDADVKELLTQAARFFPYYKVINLVLSGADLLFSKTPIE